MKARPSDKIPGEGAVLSESAKLLETELKRENPVLIMGDMNISLQIWISALAKKTVSAGCVPVMLFPAGRARMDGQADELGVVDTFRHANPQTADRFSWFDYAQKVLTITAVCVSTCFSPANAGRMLRRNRHRL